VVRQKPEEISKLLKAYQETNNPDTQLAICVGLCEARRPKDVKMIIEKALGTDGFVRPQDIFRWFAYLIRSRYSRPYIWDWLTQNWQRLEREVGDKMLDDIPTYAANPLNTKAWQKKYKDFFTPLLKKPALERNIKVAFSEIEARIAWRNREEPLIKDFFK
jgi:aminopeptidase N